MSKTRAELRVLLAREVGRYFAGTATGGSTTTLIDTGGLARWTETDALKGGYVLITAAGGAAPEGQSRRIKSFNATAQTITVDVAFTAAPESGDSYELYLAPLALESWNDCINAPIRGMWPEVWEMAIQELTPTGATNYTLSSSAEGVFKVEVSTTGAWAGRQGVAMPRSLWTVQGAPGSFGLYLLRPVPASNDLKIRVSYKKRYAELASDSASTVLDPACILAGARAAWHEMMANSGRGQADQAAHLQLMNHWQQVAAGQKEQLARELLGLIPDMGGKKT